MDKPAQAARQARLAQALRTNLRRRKAADGPPPAMRDDDGAPDDGAPDAGEASFPVATKAERPA